MSTTRDRLIDTAIDLFYFHGFNAVGLDRILDEVGVTKTTFYKHFESKDELVLEALRRRDTQEMDDLHREIRQLAGDDPRKQLTALVDVFDQWFNDEQFHGCMFIKAATEFPSPHDPVHHIAAEHEEKGFRAILDMALRAGMSESDAEAFAREYHTVLNGAIVMRHVAFKDDAAKVARRTLEMLLEKYLPQEAGEESGAAEVA